MKKKLEEYGFLTRFAFNHVGANLLMFFIILIGVFSIYGTPREIFPVIDPKIINIDVSYPGGAPEDVEEGVTRRAEEAVIGLEGVKRVTSKAMESHGQVSVELEDFADATSVYNDVRNEIDRLQNFPPGDAEKAVVSQIRPKEAVMSLAVYGKLEETRLRDWAERIEQDLLALDQISDVSLRGGAPREVTIEIPLANLEKYNLTIEDIARAAEAASLNLPAGKIESATGDILLRVREKRYFAPEFADITVISRADGTNVKIGDIARLRDGFTDKRIKNEYNGKPALFISITRNPSQDVIGLEKEVNAYLETLSLPDGVTVDIKNNRTDTLKDRINLMMKNAVGGFILLFICLLLFLDLKLAFWISAGVPIAFAGGLAISSFFGVTINMIALFALIVVLGVVVDDAIVIGESIFYEQEQTPDDPYGAVSRGIKAVVAPATVGVLTTVAAFTPLLFTTGTFGQILVAIPVVVIAILAVSLLEVYFVLPAHLSKPTRASRGVLLDIQNGVTRGTEKFVRNYLAPFTGLCIRYRYATWVFTFCFIFSAFAALSTGVIRTVFFPPVEGNQVSVSLEMPIETPFAETEKRAEAIYRAAKETLDGWAREDTHGEKVYQNISLSVGEDVTEAGPGGGAAQASGGHLAKISVELVEADFRDFTSLDFERAWRDRVGSVPGARNLSFKSGLINDGADINVELAHKQSPILEKAAPELTAAIRKIEGVTNATDAFEPGKIEFRFKLTRAGLAAGLRPADLGRQIRNAFNGREVTRVQRGREEARIMVRLLESERMTAETLERLKIKLPSGKIAPLKEMAVIETGRGYSVIDRTDGRRVIAVTADVDEEIRTSDEVTAVVTNEILPKLQRKYPGLNYSFEGATRERAEDMANLKRDMLLSIVIIFAMLAAQLRDYMKPLLIVLNIPVAVAGAIWAHAVLGYEVSFMSMFGIVALCGVAVNDSVVLIDCYNRMRDEGYEMYEALTETVRRRFRAVTLTTLTNSLGTLPILLETSVQAQFLIPMALSLSCGILFSTFFLFIFTPSGIAIVEDIRRGMICIRNACQSKS